MVAKKLVKLSILISESVCFLTNFPSDRSILALSSKFSENTAMAGKSMEYQEILYNWCEEEVNRNIVLQGQGGMQK